MPLLLSLVLVAAPLEPSPAAVTIRARAWKVAVTGGAISVTGLGFFIASRVLAGTMPTDSRVQNTTTAFQVGGVMLMATGALVALLALPMWFWTDEPTAPAIALTPLGVVGRW
ncbi:MAG: hypothetical protein Q8N26_09365 [Myxococcales bacterium]|nr:hypothetical protein [Myxococcales bacterium]